MLKKKKQRPKEKRKIISKIISYIISFIIITISSLIILLVNYIDTTFYNVTIDQLLFSLQTAEGTSNYVIESGLEYILPRLLLIYLILIVIIIIIKIFVKTKTYLKIKTKKKEYKILLFPLNAYIRVFLCLILLFTSIYYTLEKFNIFSYIDNTNTNIFEEYYIDPKTVSITAPEEKQNLIYIYVESLETSLFSSENGGNFKTSVIPNLEALANKNINFSFTNTIGGAESLSGTTWTIAAMVASTSGLPLKLPLADGNSYSGYGGFMPGAYTLGEILEENGYKNYLMLGSDAEFGGRTDYFTYHGNYEIMDYNYAKEVDLISEGYHEWWGYEDKKLYEFAKDKLTEIAKNDEPFNFTMLTADTHFVNGYLDETCDTPYDEQYLNVYHCSDQMLNNFIKWIQEQEFYENTTIIITGDHLTMQANFTEMFDTDNENERKVFNTYINTKTKPENTNNRILSTFDYYPTTLGALGFEIEGNRLGFGTNLFSDRRTLSEEILDLNWFNEQLAQNSEYYNNNILGDNYEKLVEASNPTENNDN